MRRSSALAWCFPPLATLCIGISGVRADGLAFGEPAGGLRIGVLCDHAVTPSNEQPVFTLVLENVSERPFMLPRLVVRASQIRPDDVFVLGLKPTIETEAGPDPNDWTSSERGLPEPPPEAIVLQAGEQRLFERVALQEEGERREPAEPGGAPDVRTWWLRQGGVYAIRFEYTIEPGVYESGAVWIGSAQSAPVEVRVETPSLEGFDLDVSFTPDKTELLVGEPLWVTFSATNNSPAPVGFPIGGDYRATGRPERFHITAADANGQAVPDPITHSGMGGGIGTTRRLARGERYTERLLVNRWCALDAPGTYTVKCTRTLNLVTGTEDDSRLPEEALPALPVETEIPVTLSAADAALGKLVRESVNRLQGGADLDEQFEAWARMKNRVALPAVVELARRPGEHQRSAIQWLSLYGAADAVDVLLEDMQALDAAVRATALQYLGELAPDRAVEFALRALEAPTVEERRVAVSFCEFRRPPECLPTLLKMADDPDVSVRQRLVSALGEYEDERAVPVLMRLLQDGGSDTMTRVVAARSLHRLGHDDGVPVLIDTLKSPGALGYDDAIASTLRALTGEDHGTDPAAWRAWWENR